MAQWKIDNIAQGIDTECGDDPIARTVQNAKNLLMTRMGEVPYDRMRGLDTDIFELPMPEINSLLMREMDRLLAWEPDVQAVSAHASILGNGQVLIECIIEVETE